MTPATRPSPATCWPWTPLSRRTRCWRAVTDPGLQTAAYRLIITTEALTGALFGVVALVMAARLRALKAESRAPMPWVAAGAAVAFAPWLVGFVVVGGEWFLMWQSKIWNGQEAALRMFLVTGMVLLVVIIPEREKSA